MTSKLSFDLKFKEKYNFFNEPNAREYYVNTPDILKPINGGQTILRYDDSQNAACVMYKGQYKTIVSAIPFETIKTSSDRNEFMKESISFFEQSGRKSRKVISLSPSYKVKSKNFTPKNK